MNMNTSTSNEQLNKKIEIFNKIFPIIQIIDYKQNIINNNINNNNIINIDLNLNEKIKLFNKIYPKQKFLYISPLITPRQTIDSRIIKYE